MIDLQDVCREVCSVFNVDMQMLRSPARHRAVARPRQVAMHLARAWTRLSLREIGALFGGRDHSTVIAAVKKITIVAMRDADLRAALTLIENRLRSLEPKHA